MRKKNREMTRTPKPELLVEPDWLAAHLSDPKVRVIDCTVALHVPRSGERRVDSRREAWAAAHIPGAAYLHLIEDLSAPRGHLIYNLPPADRMTETLQSVGVNADTTIVLYGAADDVYRTAFAVSVPRAWWVMRASGVKDVRILNGGLTRWIAEGHPVSSEAPTFPRGTFIARTEPDRVAGKQDVLDVLGDKSVLLINALNAEQHRGDYARDRRPGRIPGSVNVPAGDMHMADGRYKSLQELDQMFSNVGADGAERIITYCGGGIASSDACFVLELLGYDNVANYDQSLNEWGKDESLPIEVG
jgi:thiosulfate/3-mercaptopyruvate sulfurtransferase